MRKTKIVVTIGPASRERETLDQLISAGMDCARLNFSHGSLEEHGEVISLVRELSQAQGRPVAILQDLPGIKMRLGELDGLVQLRRNDMVTMVPETHSKHAFVIPFPQPGVIRNLRPGHLIFIADGSVCLEVLETDGNAIHAQVRNGGTLSSFKGVNLPGVAIDMPVLTEQDKIALDFGAKQQVDWVAISFVRTVEDIRYAREYMGRIGSKAMVMAKLERGEAIENIDAILRETDGVMIARGDLGVEIPMERVPVVQKEVVKKASDVARISVIATQMLRSMVISPTPTRAEVSDISNAVLDGADAIMMSEETAVGEYPVEAVNVAVRAIGEAEKIYPYHKVLDSRDRTQAIASSAATLARSLHAKPIVVTSTGRAAFEVSRFRPDADIIVFSHDTTILRRLALGWGLNPVGTLPPERDVSVLVNSLVHASLDSQLISERDIVTIVHGFLPGVSGTTNTIQVLDIREFLTRTSRASEVEPAARTPTPSSS
ncbi:MAG: pyruvate kinase [SAR202 cluster bacterium Io17-Chloro-G7]|nr:MAG: pyruvate kinase [SAR202 cluster bacterium Io17-Chloro-G7]